MHALSIRQTPILRGLRRPIGQWAEIDRCRKVKGLTEIKPSTARPHLWSNESPEIKPNAYTNAGGCLEKSMRIPATPHQVDMTPELNTLIRPQSRQPRQLASFRRTLPSSDI